MVVPPLNQQQQGLHHRPEKERSSRPAGPLEVQSRTAAVAVVVEGDIGQRSMAGPQLVGRAEADQAVRTASRWPVAAAVRAGPPRTAAAPERKVAET